MNSYITVAVADDNERLLLKLRDIIKSESKLKLVGLARNGEEIINIIKEEQPDIVITDIIMPKIDGLTVMERINNDLTVKKIPKFIVISSVGQETIVENALVLGAYYYFQKQFEEAVIIDEIKSTYEDNSRRHDFQFIKKVK